MKAAVKKDEPNKEESKKEEAKDETNTADALLAEVKAAADEETLQDLYGKDDEGELASLYLEERGREIGG